MASFALLVTVRVHPGTESDFERHILRAAAAAVREEPDCQLFHVARAEDDPRTFLLWEVYANAEALAYHHAQPHFLEFRRLSADWIAEKSSRRLALCNPANLVAPPSVLERD